MQNWIDKIVSDENIERALLSFNRKGSSGPDGKNAETSIQEFNQNRALIVEQLRNSSYKIQPAQRVYQSKNGKRRPLDLLNIQDRIIERMVMQVLSPVFDQNFSSSSHGFRSGKGRHTALRQALETINSGSEYLLQLDIHQYFQNVDQDKLVEIVSRTITEKSVLDLIRSCLQAGYLENDQLHHPEKGMPQGAPISPLLSNIYLSELDNELDKRSIPFIRFADDALVITESQKQAEVVRRYLEKWLPKTLGLELSPEKTKIVGPENCEILGYKIIRNGDGIWTTSEPLPIEKEAHSRSPKQKSASEYSESRKLEITDNPRLEGLREATVTGKKWMPKDQAKRIKDAVNSQFSVAEVAQALGFTVLNHSSNYQKILEHDSCIIWPETNKFKRFSKTDVGGGPLDFYMHFQGVDYFTALRVFENRIVNAPLREKATTNPIPGSAQLTPLQRDLRLHDEIQKRNQQPAQNMKNVFGYLIRTRQIDPGIVSEHVKRGCIQQITDQKGQTHCVFIGRDEHGLMCAACFRTTSSTQKFMGDFSGCDYTRGWFYDPEWDQSTLCLSESPTKPAPDKPLLCFESYIEMLSYQTILKQSGFDYRKFAYLSCGSVTKSRAIEQTCERYGYKTVKVMFNNDLEQEKDTGDNPGKEAAEKTVQSLKEKGIAAEAIFPSSQNDWNDELRIGKFSKCLQQERHNKQEKSK